MGEACARAQNTETVPPLISVIVCAHNEEEYVDRCLPKLLKSLRGFSHEIIFVADRCTDRTVEKARKYDVKIIDKKWKKWKNSYAESLQTGYLNARGSYVSIVDIDVIVPSNFFKELAPRIEGNLASVASNIVTYPNTLWNRLIYAWEKTYDLAPLGREPYGAARIMLKRAIDEIHGIRDVPAPDTDIDVRLEKSGYRSVATSAVKVYHIRRVSPKTMVRGQINSGRGRYALGVTLARTAGHAIFRFRPLVICGWLLEWQRSLYETQQPKTR